MAGVRSPPFVEVEGIHNFRSIGGWPIASDPVFSVRRGLVFHSAEPSKVTPRGMQKLKELGITTFFDLRSTAELEKMKARTPVVDIEGIKRVFVPAFPDDMSPETIAVRYRHYASEGPEVG